MSMKYQHKITEEIKANFQIQLADALLDDDAALIKLVKPKIPSKDFDKASLTQHNHNSLTLFIAIHS